MAKSKRQLDREIDEVLSRAPRRASSHETAVESPYFGEPTQYPEKTRTRTRPGREVKPKTAKAKTLAKAKTKTLSSKKKTASPRTRTPRKTRAKASPREKKVATPKTRAARKTSPKKTSPKKPVVKLDPRVIVMNAVTSMPSSGRFGDDKVFVSEIWKRVGRKVAPTLPGFKKWLLEQNRLRNLNLARADLVGAMDPKQVQESEISDMGATFHFVLDPTRRGW